MKRDAYTEKRNGNNGRGIIFCLLRQTNHPRSPLSFVGVRRPPSPPPPVSTFLSFSLDSLRPFTPFHPLFRSSSLRFPVCLPRDFLSFSEKCSARCSSCRVAATPPTFRTRQNPRSPRLDICQINRVVSGWRGTAVSYSIDRINHPSV